MALLASLSDLNDLDHSLSTLEDSIQAEIEALEGSHPAPKAAEPERCNEELIADLLVADLLPFLSREWQTALLNLAKLCEAHNLGHLMRSIDLAAPVPFKNSVPYLDQLAQVPALHDKLKLVSNWIIRQAFKTLSASYSGSGGHTAGTASSYQTVFKSIRSIFGEETALRLLIEHRTTLFRL